MGKLIRQFPKDPHVTGTYYKLLKDYRRATKYHKKMYKQDMINKLDELHDQSPREYWKLLSKLKNGNNNTDQTSRIDPGTWLYHFKQLNTNKTRGKCNNDSILPHTTQVPQPMLNKEIETCEVQRP